MTSPKALLVASAWLALVAGLMTALVVVEFPRIPGIPEPTGPWLLPTVFLVTALVTVVELRAAGDLPPLGRPAEASPRDRASALACVRSRLAADLEYTMGGVSPLVLPIEGAESVVAAYDSDRSLLVLGSSGSGKSTELLRLADVLAQRAAGEGGPLPVVLSLAGWGRGPSHRPLFGRGPDEGPPPLVDWLLGRAFARYRIPHGTAREWLRRREIVLLLDGLDEVRPDLLVRCVADLNELLTDATAPAMVVSCRSADHRALPVKPLLRQTVTVAPLAPERMAQYLDLGGTPVSDEFAGAIHSPLCLRVAQQVRDRVAPRVGPEDLRRGLLDTHLTDRLGRRDDDQARLLRQLSLLIRLAGRTDTPDVLTPRTLNTLSAPLPAELAVALRTWVMPSALATALTTGLVLPLLLRFGVLVGVLAAVAAGFLSSVSVPLSDSPGYVVDPLAGRWSRRLVGVLGGIVLGAGVGGACALLSVLLCALPDGFWLTVAIGAVSGVAVAVGASAPRAAAGLGTALATTVVLWRFHWTDPSFQRVLLTAAVGLVGYVVVLLTAPRAAREEHATDSGPVRIAVAWTAVFAGGTVAAGFLAGLPVDGPVVGAVAGLVLALVGGWVARSLGSATAAMVVPAVRRLGLCWAGLLPIRLGVLLRESVRRGLVAETADGFRLPHPLVRDRIARIDVFDGRLPQPLSSQSGKRRRALARIGTWLEAQPEPRDRIALRLRRVDDGSLLDGADPPALARALATSGDRMALLGQIGSGTSTLLAGLAQALWSDANADPRQPVPLPLDLGSLPARSEYSSGVVRPFTRWVVTQAWLRYGIPAETALEWLTDRRFVLLLDGYGQGGHARRDAAMVAEFLMAYDVAVVVAGWALGPAPAPCLTTVTVEPLGRVEAAAALSEYPHVTDFLGEDATLWSALDTVDRIRLVVQAGGSPPAGPADGLGRSYLAERLAGMPDGARLWYSGALGAEDDRVNRVTYSLFLHPAGVVALALLWGFGSVAAVACWLVATLAERFWKSRLAAQLMGLAVALVLGAGLSAVAREFGDRAVNNPDIPVTATSFGVGFVFGAGLWTLCLFGGSIRVVSRALPFLFVGVAYALFDGPTRMGQPLEALGGIGYGAFFGSAVGCGGILVFLALDRLVRLCVGVRPWRVRRFRRTLATRRLTGWGEDSSTSADPIALHALRSDGSA